MKRKAVCIICKEQSLHPLSQYCVVHLEEAAGKQIRASKISPSK